MSSQKPIKFNACQVADWENSLQSLYQLRPHSFCSLVDINDLKNLLSCFFKFVRYCPRLFGRVPEAVLTQTESFKQYGLPKVIRGSKRTFI